MLLLSYRKLLRVGNSPLLNPSFLFPGKSHDDDDNYDDYDDNDNYDDNDDKSLFSVCRQV